ncbi:hypothetical protein BDW22DRAFT_1359809 [Trametopsis cervina]|nr:hypothetical protein BDW22DRAFT_1359809 [Trametopsis cervina]
MAVMAVLPRDYCTRTESPRPGRHQIGIKTPAAIVLVPGLWRTLPPSSSILTILILLTVLTVLIRAIVVVHSEDTEHEQRPRSPLAVNGADELYSPITKQTPRSTTNTPSRSCSPSPHRTAPIR